VADGYVSRCRRNGDVSFTVFGWWVRLVWGVTFKPKRVRWHRAYGYRMLAVRLYGDPFNVKLGRLVGVQWRRAR